MDLLLKIVVSTSQLWEFPDSISVSEEDIDRGVRLDLGEVHLDESVSKGLGPHPSSLPKSIGCE